MRKLIFTIALLFIASLTFSQPYYKYEKIGDIHISQELVGAFVVAYNALMEGGVDVSRLRNHLDAVYYVEDLGAFTSNPRAIGTTLTDKDEDREGIILVSRHIDSAFFIQIIIYHEMTHFILDVKECERGIFLFTPPLPSDVNSRYNKERFHLYVKELIDLIIQEQKNGSRN